MKHYGDITKLNGWDLPIVDIITGGSPCQDLSVAGKRAGATAIWASEIEEFPRKANPEDRLDYCETSELYKGEDFDEIDSYKGIIFTDKSDCQRYCDYLNERRNKT